MSEVPPRHGPCPIVSQSDGQQRHIFAEPDDSKSNIRRKEIKDTLCPKMGRTEESKFEILTIPMLERDNNDPPPLASVALARKFRQLRLTALKTAPEAFATCYDVARQRGLDVTLERLSNPKVVNLVASKVVTAIAGVEHENKEIDHLLAGEWVGMTVLMGPQDAEQSPVSARADPFSSMIEPTVQSKIPEKESFSSTRKLQYHINAVFVDPSARNSGLGLALINAALGKAKEQAKSFRRDYVCNILVDSRNTAAWRLYEKAGFVQVDEETYVQQPRGELGEVEQMERVAIRMELHGTV